VSHGFPRGVRHLQWELTADVLAQFPKPTHAAPIVRRCIVPYALCCPNDEAKLFVTAVRQSDPKLVKHVEDVLELFAPVKHPQSKNESAGGEVLRVRRLQEGLGERL